MLSHTPAKNPMRGGKNIRPNTLTLATSGNQTVEQLVQDKMWQIGTTMVMAIKQVLDYRSTLRAIGVVLIGIIPAGFVLLFMTIILVGMLGIE